MMLTGKASVAAKFAIGKPVGVSKYKYFTGHEIEQRTQ
jgi:hypothetical protein